MNAWIRNECEKELLIIFKEVVNSLELDIEIESQALTEGGLKEIWRFLGNNGVQLTLLVTVIGVILSRFPVENRELVSLQIENLKLDNEIKKKELIKITNEVKSTENITEELIDRVITILDKDYRIIWHKSNYYKKLNLYPKVTKISTQKLNDDNEPIDEERTVLRNEFSSFILRSDVFPPNIDENAVIDIISPVLKKGNFSWKGFYNGEILTFEMSDKNFQTSVLNKEVEFINGVAIKCVLHQSRKIDETGLVKIVHSKVLTVLEIVNMGSVSATEQGKKYKRNKFHASNQGKLDL